MGGDWERQLREKNIEELQVYVKVIKTGTKRFIIFVMLSYVRNLNWFSDQLTKIIAPFFEFYS